MCKIKAEDNADAYYQLPEKTLIIFSSDYTNFQLNNDNEIIAGGRLYDIVKAEISNGKTIYYTLSDEEEDVYVQQLNDWGKSNTGEKSLPTKTVGLHVGKYFGIKEFDHPLPVSSHRLHTHLRLSNDLFLYTSPFRNIFSPPPDKFLS